MYAAVPFFNLKTALRSWFLHLRNENLSSRQKHQIVRNRRRFGTFRTPERRPSQYFSRRPRFERLSSTHDAEESESRQPSDGSTFHYHRMSRGVNRVLRSPELTRKSRYALTSEQRRSENQVRPQERALRLLMSATAKIQSSPLHPPSGGPRGGRGSSRHARLSKEGVGSAFGAFAPATSKQP